MQILPFPGFGLCAAAMFLAVLGGGGPAVAAFSDWSEGPNVRARLIATTPGADNGPNAALELELAPGWKTYWRSPGDAGIPPAFDFAGSTNLKAVTIGYPPPERVDDGYAVSNVYAGRIVLPLTVEPLEAGKPVALTMKVDLGVCEEVCIPVTLETAVSLVPGNEDGEAADLLAAAVRALPAPPLAGIFDITGLRRAGGDDDEPVFEFRATVPDPSRTEVFIEGPADWYPDVPKPVSGEGNAVTYRVSFDRLGAKTPIAKAGIRFTVVSGGRAIEETLTLD